MIKEIVNKFLNKETISYLIFGILTTIVNFVSYELCKVAGIGYEVSTIIAWGFAVAFAYITNKLFVFESKSFDKTFIFKEASTFVLSRLFSGICDFVFMLVVVGMYGMNDSIAKLLTNVFVVIINYILSKLFVFKER